MSGRHKGGTKSFRDLTFDEQARSINATINNLRAAIGHHVEHSPRPPDTARKCLAQIERLSRRLRESYPESGAPSGSGVNPLNVEERPRVRVGSPRLARPDQAADFMMEVGEDP